MIIDNTSDTSAQHSLISVVLQKQVSYRYHDKRKSFINGLFTPFMKLCLLLKLNRSRWFASQIIEYPVNSPYLIYNSAHDCLENLEWNLCTLCCHEINCVDCTKCNRIIVSSFVTHNTNGTHVSEGCEILVWHPCWSLAVSFLVLSYGLVNL